MLIVKKSNHSLSPDFWATFVRQIADKNWPKVERKLDKLCKPLAVTIQPVSDPTGFRRHFREQRKNRKDVG